jgi:hypothetical protein
MTEVEKAKKVLREAGYFTDNLWHVDDVKLRFQVFDDEDAQDILQHALVNDWTMEQIHYIINDIATERGYKPLEHED